MDYGKLTKEELILECNSKNIPFSSTFTKDRLIELLIDYEKENRVKKDNQLIGPASLGKAGAIITIMCSTMYLLTIILIMMMIYLAPYASSISAVEVIFWLFWFMIPTGTIILCSRYLRGHAKSKMLTGIWGIFFGGIIGGAFILISEYEPKLPKNKNAVPENNETQN